MDRLPIDILDSIAGLGVYWEMLAMPVFARGITPDRRADWMIRLGFTINITQYMLQWKRHGKRIMTSLIVYPHDDTFYDPGTSAIVHYLHRDGVVITAPLGMDMYSIDYACEDPIAYIFSRKSPVYYMDYPYYITAYGYVTLVSGSLDTVLSMLPEILRKYDDLII
jgi:hypothetical protein